VFSKSDGKIIDEIRSLLTKLIGEIYVYKFSQSNCPRRKCVSMANQCKHYCRLGGWLLVCTEVSREEEILVRPLLMLHCNSDRGFLASAGKYTLKLYWVGVGFDLRARTILSQSLAVVNLIPTDWKLVCCRRRVKDTGGKNLRLRGRGAELSGSVSHNAQVGKISGWSCQ